MKIQRHSVWGIYDDRANSLEKFIKNFIPKMKLREEVSKDVVESYNVIRRLLIHSYYEYEFIDVAVNKLLQTFEMSLKIRFKELNEEEWPKRKPLAQLVDWFRKDFYFENNNKSYLDHVRNVRNYFSHPQNHSFGGIAMFHWFDTITDLVNDVYGDVDLRKQRLQEVENLNTQLKEIIKNGAVIDLAISRNIVYEVVIYTVDNVSDVKKLFGYYKVIFKLEEELKTDETRENSIVFFEIEDYQLEINRTGISLSNMFKILLIDKTENRKKYDWWISKIKSSREDQMYDTSLSLDIQKEVQNRRRKILQTKG